MSTLAFTVPSRWGAGWRRFPAVVATAAVGAGSLAVFGVSASGLTMALFLAVLVPLSVIDVERRILPNAIVLPAAALVLGAHIAAEPEHAAEWVLGAGGAAAVLFILCMVNPAGMGMGDVKLALLLGAGLGAQVVLALAVASLSVWPVALYLFLRRGATPRGMAIPFGPFLAFGAVAVALLGSPVATAAGLSAHAEDAATKTPKRAKMRAPALQSPADELAADAVPAFTWGAVKGAERYEFQLSADGAFRSIVLGQGNGSFQTKNTAATINKALSDGNYFWRVRGVNAKGDAGPWSRTRTLRKTWSQPPTLSSPADGATVNYPQPAVLSWSAVPRAYKYELEVATDPQLGSPAPGFSKPLETSGTDYALPLLVSAGRYYWAVTPLDGQKHKGQRSVVGSFEIGWPSATSARIDDLNPDSRVYDPQFSWDAVPGAGSYEVEVNSSADWATGSKVCCTGTTIGTSLSPTQNLANNVLYWRVRAIDPDGNAGSWNVGPTFRKDFDNVVPTIPNLRVRNNQVDPLPLPDPSAPGNPPVSTSNPIIQWDPVPGASAYEVDVSTWSGSGCNWTNMHGYTTATTAWTPLATPPPFPHKLHIGPNNWPTPSTDLAGISYVAPGATYCVRVMAISDRPSTSTNGYISAATQLNGVGKPAFAYETGPNDPAPPSTTPDVPFETPAGAYIAPASGSVNPRMPVFTWNRVAGADAYYVVVAKDSMFTNIIDIAYTQAPAYAPRDRLGAITYPEETTSYYWAVVPWNNTQASTTLPWENNHPTSFDKRSVAPALISPPNGGDVVTQPSFRWTEPRDSQGQAEGARNYRLQVSRDPSFENLIEDVTTASTAYTSSSTYPADTVLYWRVRANDEKGTGLAWSSTQTFKRRLPAPVPSPENPAGGRTIPTLKWSPVEGAVSYDLHVDQPDGTQKDFTLRSPVFTPAYHYGTGVWQWKVRANFPKMPFGSIPGAYTERQSFTRFIGAPAGTRGVASARRMLLSWDPVEMARSYKVEVANSSSFTFPIEAATTDNTSFAPKLMHPAFADGGTLYWRVATIDEGNNVGGYTTGTFSLPKRIKVAVKGNLRRGSRARITVKVTDVRGRKVRKAKVRVTGAGLRAIAKRTTARGTTTFQLRPPRKGKVLFLASKGGYRSGSTAVQVIQ
jgi:Flp pilus assembly protein protease CpaA